MIRLSESDICRHNIRKIFLLILIVEENLAVNLLAQSICSVKIFEQYCLVDAERNAEIEFSENEDVYANAQFQRVSSDQLKLLHKLGEGISGKVYAGSYKLRNRQMVVAVKTVNCDDEKSKVRELAE